MTATEAAAPAPGAQDASPTAPRRAALAALAELPAVAPLPSVSYRSQGNLLVIGGDAPQRAHQAAARLAGDLHVTLLAERETPAEGPYAVWSGRVAALTGYLGEFTATLESLRMSGAAGPSAAL